MASSNQKSGPGEVIAWLRDITVTYDGYQTRSLSHVSVDFRRAEIVGVLGSKAAGKSTLLKVLAGRIAPTEGTAKIFGRSARRGSARLRIGYLAGKVDSSHAPGFFARFFRPKERPSSSARGVARLTQAVLGNRDLLVLDDPLEGLAPAEVAEAKSFVRELAARGKTVVLSSDSLMDVKDLCQRMVVLDEGRIQAAGTLAELLSSGGAIRFLPAVLPREIVERVLKVLREEISGGSVPVVEAATLPAEASVHSAKLSGLPVSSRAGDTIDHEKLAELTKQKKPE